MRNTFKSIDLFAGIGGFHQAMVQLGGECVYASEIDKFCIERYKENYNIDANNDITKIAIDTEVYRYHDLKKLFPFDVLSEPRREHMFDYGHYQSHAQEKANRIADDL